jgi:uncharacterized protein (DUF1015 family)
MITVKPFSALRPREEYVKECAALPYDVMSSDEARKEVKGKPYSFLHIDKAEIDLDPSVDLYDDTVYAKAAENLKKFETDGVYVQDEKKSFYFYRQIMDGRAQTGIVGCASIDDYLENRIKKHELTRKDKEEDRMIHVRIQDANIEPVFFAYPDVAEMNEIVENIVKNQEPEYDFVAEDGFGHTFWAIRDAAVNARITEIFAEIPALYVADGHHRTAAAALVGAEKRAANPNHTGEEEYNYFLAVIFPESQLKIIDYNRVVKDLNGLTSTQFLEKLSESFDVVEMGAEIYKPNALHNFGMYLDGKWYSLTAKVGTYNDNDPIGVLDVTVLSNLVFDNILNLGDLRTSKRIDFVGGIRGLGELQKRVDSGEMVAAFALYPVTMRQIIDIADTGNIMPPKTTWFEPKLRSGLVIHKLS